MLNLIKKITFEITNDCDLRCKICNIWKESKKLYLSYEQIERILEQIKNPISISLTGGEPFLHPRLEKIYRYLFKLFLQKKVCAIDISTNAYSDNILNFLAKNRNYLKSLSLSISLDGIGNIHNMQRGQKDAFSKTFKNIQMVKRFKIPIICKFVISKINYKDITKVYLLSKKLNCNLYIKFFEKVKNYYHRYHPIPRLDLNSNELFYITPIIEKIFKIEYKKNKNNIFGLSLLSINNYLKNKNLNFINKCYTPKNSLFITSNGDIYSCLYQERIGSIKMGINFNEKKFQKIYVDARAGKCPKCLSYHGFLKEFNLQ